MLLLGVCAGTAGAQSLSLTFTEARANVGVQLDDEPLFGAPATAPFEAQIDPGSGQITAGHLTVPQFFTHITTPITADVSVDFEIGEIEGSFNQATGALVLEGKAGGILTAQSGEFEGEECGVSTSEILVESTAGKAAPDGSPRSGVPFSQGLTGAGSIAGQWSDMEATPVEPSNGDNVSFCNSVENRIEGPGGVWLEQKGEVVTPSVPQPIGQPVDPLQPPACVVPKVAGMKLKAAKKKIRAAGCTVGKVHKPKRTKGKSLVVKASNPAAGATKPAGAEVRLRLGPKPQQ